MIDCKDSLIFPQSKEYIASPEMKNFLYFDFKWQKRIFIEYLSLLCTKLE